MKSRLGKRAGGDIAFPWMTPAIYGKLQEEVDAACDEMICTKIKHPSLEMTGQMCNRVYENVKSAYPGVEKYAQAFDKHMPMLAGGPVGGFDVTAQWGGGAFLGLIALLLLAGFYRRRGYTGRGGRY